MPMRAQPRTLRITELRGSVPNAGAGGPPRGSGHRLPLCTALIVQDSSPSGVAGVRLPGRPPSPSTRALLHSFRRPARHRRLCRGRRGGHQQRSPRVQHRRPAARGGQGGPRAGQCRPGQCRLRVSAPPHHGQPRARRHSQGRLGVRSAHRPGDPYRQRPGPWRSARPHAGGRRGGTRGRPAARPRRALHGAGGPVGRLRRPAGPRGQPARSGGGHRPRGPWCAHAAAGVRPSHGHRHAPSRPDRTSPG